MSITDFHRGSLKVARVICHYVYIESYSLLQRGSVGLRLLGSLSDPGIPISCSSQAHCAEVSRWEVLPLMQFKTTTETGQAPGWQLSQKRRMKHACRRRTAMNFELIILPGLPDIITPFRQ